jgi:hypothetical protein
VTIPTDHLPINVEGTLCDLTHLQAFTTAIAGKGIVAGTDLVVEVVFSNHVYTERTRHGEKHHVLDQHGSKRTFDGDRYEMSKALGGAIRSKITQNALTHVSRSYGGIDNLVFVEMADGRTWGSYTASSHVPMIAPCGWRSSRLTRKQSIARQYPAEP